jgi:hypothetical protein
MLLVTRAISSFHVSTTSLIRELRTSTDSICEKRLISCLRKHRAGRDADASEKVETEGIRSLKGRPTVFLCEGFWRKFPLKLCGKLQVPTSGR